MAKNFKPKNFLKPSHLILNEYHTNGEDPCHSCIIINRRCNWPAHLWIQRTRRVKGHFKVISFWLKAPKAPIITKKPPEDEKQVISVSQCWSVVLMSAVTFLWNQHHRLFLAQLLLNLWGVQNLTSSFMKLLLQITALPSVLTPFNHQHLITFSCTAEPLNQVYRLWWAAWRRILGLRIKS